MVSVTKRYGLSVVLVLSALLVTLLVRPETLIRPIFFPAVILSAWLGGMGPGLVAALLATLTIDYFFLPPKYTLRFNPAELPELLSFLVSAVVVSAWSAIRTRTETLLRRRHDRAVAHETSAGIDRRVDLYRALVALVTRLDSSRANRPVSPDRRPDALRVP
jgi:K+-sensing histidine kinase KdpD